MCVCIDQTGNTVSFDKSITVAPAGIARLAPTPLIFSPSMRITWSMVAVPVSGSISRPALIAVIGVAGGCASTGTNEYQDRNNQKITLRFVHASSFSLVIVSLR